MSKTAATATFSELLRSPKDVLSVLADAGEVVLTRRQAPSLRLTQESDSQQELSTLSTGTGRNWAGYCHDRDAECPP